MPTAELTAKLVAGARAPTTGRLELWDTKVMGLMLRVTPQGVKTWSVRYRLGGQRQRYTLGPYPALSLADARDLARQALHRVALGQDPSATKREARDAETVGALVDRFLVEYVDRKPLKAGGEVRRIFETYVLPAWRHRKAKEIRRTDVKALLGPISARAPIQANRVKARLSKFFNWCVEEELLDASPATQLRANDEHERQRVLSAAEIRALWTACEAVDAERVRLVTPLMASFFQLRLLTAQRGGEVAAMRWSEIDGEWWTIPPERSKNGLAHRVYLSALARAILDDLAASRRDGIEWVFPSPRTPARRARLLEALPAEPADALPLEVLLVRVPTVVTTARKALRVFIARGLVGTHGTGVRGDPLRYYRMTAASVVAPRRARGVPHLSHYQKAWDRLCAAGEITDAVSHDLRRTAASGMASLGVPRLVISKVLNHVEPGVTRVYDRYSYDDEKRDALTKWGAHVMAVVASEPAGATVCPLVPAAGRTR